MLGRGYVSGSRRPLCVALLAVLAFTFLAAGRAAAATHGRAVAAAFTAHGSVEQVYVIGLRPGDRISLLDRGGRTIATKPASSGYGYLTTRDGIKLAIDVHPPRSPAGEPGLPAGVTLPSNPTSGPPLPPGVTLPSTPATGPPYPTLIEYSGYGYADPSGPQNGIASSPT